MQRILMLLCCNPRASRPTPVSDVSQFKLTSFVIKSLHVLLLINLQLSLLQILAIDRLIAVDSFSYVTRTGDVTRCAGVVLDTVGTGLLTGLLMCLLTSLLMLE